MLCFHSQNSVWLAVCVRKGLITKQKNVNALTRKISKHLCTALPRIQVCKQRSHTSVFELGSRSICLDTNYLLQKISNFFYVAESSSCLAIRRNIQVPRRIGCKLQHWCIVNGGRRISRFLQKRCAEKFKETAEMSSFLFTRYFIPSDKQLLLLLDKFQQNLPQPLPDVLFFCCWSVCHTHGSVSVNI